MNAFVVSFNLDKDRYSLTYSIVLNSGITFIVTCSSNTIYLLNGQNVKVEEIQNFLVIGTQVEIITRGEELLQISLAKYNKKEKIRDKEWKNN